MSYAARSLPPEAADASDAIRLAAAERQKRLNTLHALARADIRAGSIDRKDVLDLRRLVAANEVPLTQKQADRINALAWKYRRQLPRGIAPLLNPNDPVVRELAAQEPDHVR